MSNNPFILRVAINTPLRKLFDYLPMEGVSPESFSIGARVGVPFGRRKIVGIIVEKAQHTKISSEKLKSIIELIDKESIFPSSILKLCQWASDYYHHPIGEVILGALPKNVREGKPLELPQEIFYELNLLPNFSFEKEFSKATKQKIFLETIQRFQGRMSEDQIKRENISSSVINALIKKDWVIKTQKKIENKVSDEIQLSEVKVLNSDQQKAIQAISEEKTFKTFLLAGVTGSGKTEVYLKAIANLKPEQQALVLVPEIALTPQTVKRFTQRFKSRVVVMHSKLSDKERLKAWMYAKSGEAKIVIGTRSAIFTPLLNPGIIILDEEHDLSFKQQSGFRYSARDMAVMRGYFENFPVVLGSATPSLESLYNVNRERYQLLSLPFRAGNSTMPLLKTIDLREKKLQGGLSEELIQAIKKHLNQDHQILLFLNRRGYAPTLRCHHCGWIAQCKHCDARLTLHQVPRKLICHHCGFCSNPPRICVACEQSELSELGMGTQRLEETIKNYFPHQTILRIDRDSMSGNKKIQNALEKAHSNEAKILIGTQMLAKGHHFENLNLVAIIDADNGFFSSDFRATERMAQLIMQVAGRAGRAEKQGEVILQTFQPEHPLIQTLIHEGYEAFSKKLLEERKITALPPFSYFALMKADSKQNQQSFQFLEKIKKIALQFKITQIQILGPVCALMEKKAGVFRAQLLFQSEQRTELQLFLQKIMACLESQKIEKNIRWSLDVDPLEL